MHTFYILFLLSVGYSLVWYLLNTSMFITSRGRIPGMNYPMALVLGIMSAVLHVIICVLKGDICSF